MFMDWLQDSKADQNSSGSPEWRTKLLKVKSIINTEHKVLDNYFA